MPIHKLRDSGMREIAYAKVLCLEWYGADSFDDIWPEFKKDLRYDSDNNELVSPDNRRNPVHSLGESIKILNAAGIK